jgi:putative PIN family toxin of toxin-antitoxin system
MIRMVIDTNVLISAVFWTGKPKALLNKARRGEITFLTSKALLAELKDVLTRNDKPFGLTEDEAKRVVDELKGVAELIETKSTVAICNDEDDNRVIECAIDGKADFIVTGDPHLLKIGYFEKIKILKVADFFTL